MGPFKSQGHILPEVVGKTLKISHDQNTWFGKRNCRKGNYIYAGFVFSHSTKYSIKLYGRVTGTNTRVKMAIYDKHWNKITESDTLPVSSEMGVAQIEFITESEKDCKYYIKIAILNSTNHLCHMHEYSSHTHKIAYLESLSYCVIKEENQFSNINIVENDEKDLLKFTLVDGSTCMANDSDIHSAFVDKYIKVNVTCGGATGLYHLPLYKLDI